MLNVSSLRPFSSLWTRSVITKKGYIPKMFNPYNCSEIKDIAPTLATNCGGLTVSSTVLIIEVVDK